MRRVKQAEYTVPVNEDPQPIGFIPLAVFTHPMTILFPLFVNMLPI